MVVVRESPRAVRSPDKNPSQWPPKSPFQALLSSPGGRKKWQDHRCRTAERSPSPSPGRRSVESARKMHELGGLDVDNGEVDAEEDDEETLQLQLQEIQAKLRLKKLRKTNKADPNDQREHDGHMPIQQTASSHKSISSERARRRTVEVPLSPIRRMRPLQEQLSPARVKLGLDSTLKAEHVSLKRARDGSQIKRNDSHNSWESSQHARTTRIKSFSEKIAEKELKADQLEAKRERLDSIRNTTFSRPSATLGVPLDEVERRRNRVDDELRNGSTWPTSVAQPRNYSQHHHDGQSRHATPKEHLREAHSTLERDGELSMQAPDYHQSGNRPSRGDDNYSSLTTDASSNAAGYDPFTQIQLSNRHIQHSVVAREMASKEVYTLPRLLKEVKSPDYEPPDCESDYVVFAILASKSTPFDQAQTHKQTDGHAPDTFKAPTNKFMVLHLCDLDWEIDLFLFGTAFNQFWKLTPGTLLAILNPAIMPPKGNKHSGRFSLKLGSSEDAIMEIGVAQDLGYCVSKKRDGQPCGAWVDKRKTEACEFHIDLQIERSRKGRMEVNTMWRGTGPDVKAKGRLVRDRRTDKAPAGKSYDREHGTLYPVNTGVGRSVASLLDADDMEVLHDMTQEEASRKRLAAAQKERDLAKKLGEIGNGVGAEYLRAKHSTALPNSNKQHTTDGKTLFFSKPSASELGLLGNKASSAHLSPAKDRKRHFGLGAVSMATGGHAALGWGCAGKAGLLQPKQSRFESPETGQTRLQHVLERPRRDAAGSVFPRPPSQDSNAESISPGKKRARFALEKGIREPGRESLPGDGLTQTITSKTFNDDDDDLDIV